MASAPPEGFCAFHNDDDHTEALMASVGICRHCRVQKPLNGVCNCKRPLKRSYLRKQQAAALAKKVAA